LRENNRNDHRSGGCGIALYYGASLWWLSAEYHFIPCRSDENCHCPVLILGREHYQEVTISVPMSNRQEIRNAIIFDPDAFLPPELSVADNDSPDGNSRAWFFRRLLGYEESTEVNLWVMNESSRPMIDSFDPLWIIPETAVLPEYEQRLLWKIERPDGSWLFAGCEPDGAVRSLPLTDPEAELNFTRIIGGELAERRELDQEQWPAYLGQKVFAGRHRRWEVWPRLLQYWQNFRYPSGWSRRFGGLRQHRLTLALVAGLLLLLFAGQLLLPWYLQHSVTEQVDRLEPEVAQVLKVRKKLEQFEERNQTILDTVERRVSATMVLNLVKRTFPKQGKLFTLKISGDQVSLTGEVLDGSGFLQHLSAEPGVLEAHFMTPLRKIRKSSRQSFSIGFRFVDKNNNHHEVNRVK